MKNIVYLFTLCISLFCIPAFAQGVPENVTPATSVTTPAITSAPIPSVTLSTIPSATPPTITWPEVSDKTLGLLKDSAVVIGNVIKDVAPEAWRILILQQYVKGIQSILVAIICLIVSWAIWKFIPKKFTNKHERDVAQVFCSIFAFVFLMVAGFTVVSSVGFFINPEFYAIKDLFCIVKGCY